jgi:polysaccharide export outer membrane protein
MHIRTETVAILSLISFILTGCYSSNPKDIEAFTKPQNVNVSTDEYILQPPDEIEIHCSKVPEVDLQVQQIRPDGKVSFESLGEIDAAGKTPKQLANTMRAKILELYKLSGDNPIDVRITVYRSKFYYVIGQVTHPGPQIYTGRDTVLNALSLAVPTVLAWEQRVQVVRPSSDKSVKPKIFEVNFDRMTAHGDTSKNVLLEEGDILYVPPTILAGIALVIEEFTRPITSTFSTVNVVYGTPAYREAGGGI